MSSTLSVWVVDDDPAACWLLERALAGDGATPRIFAAAGSSSTTQTLNVELMLSYLSVLTLMREDDPR